jgi:hypothetical protein
MQVGLLPMKRSAVGCGAHRAAGAVADLGTQFVEQAADLASLCVVYRRWRSLFDEHELAR